MENEKFLPISKGKHEEPVQRYFQKGEFVIVVDHPKLQKPKADSPFGNYPAPISLSSFRSQFLDHCSNDHIQDGLPIEELVSSIGLSLNQLSLQIADNEIKKNLDTKLDELKVEFDKESKKAETYLDNNNGFDFTDLEALAQKIQDFSSQIAQFVVFENKIIRRANPSSDNLFQSFLNSDVAGSNIRFVEFENLGMDSSENPMSRSVIIAKVGEESIFQDDNLLLYSALNLQEVIDGGISSENITIRAISPSWFFVSTMGDIIVGGPASIPIPIQRLNFDYQACEINNGSEVDVFVLDTAPSLAQMNWAVSEFSGNELLTNTRGKVGTPHYYTYDPSQRDEVFFIPALFAAENHLYDTSDHGGFICGLINEKAHTDRVNLQLIEVLNSHGIGTFGSILAGQRKFLDLHRESINTIVNCSFTVSFPKDFSKFFLGFSFPSLNSLFEKGLATLLFLPLVSLDNDKLIIVAAAGNGSSRDEIVLAGYPASLSQIVGVGASKKGENEREDYSNEPRDSNTFVYTEGGGVNHKETSIVDGISGIFTNPYFPDVSQNLTGWGKWSGTSFATANVSAKIACQLLKAASFITAQQAFTMLKEAGPAGDDSGAPGPPPEQDKITTEKPGNQGKDIKKV